MIVAGWSDSNCVVQIVNVLPLFTLYAFNPAVPMDAVAQSGYSEALLKTHNLQFSLLNAMPSSPTASAFALNTTQPGELSVIRPSTATAPAELFCVK